MFCGIGLVMVYS